MHEAFLVVETYRHVWVKKYARYPRFLKGCRLLGLLLE